MLVLDRFRSSNLAPAACTMQSSHKVATVMLLVKQKGPPAATLQGEGVLPEVFRATVPKSVEIGAFSQAQSLSVLGVTSSVVVHVTDHSLVAIGRDSSATMGNEPPSC